MPRKLTQKEVENKITERLGDVIDFSLFTYKNSYTKSTFICKKCGNVFNSIPKSLMSGHGCKKCSDANTFSKRRRTQEDVLKKLSERLGDKYILDRVQYYNARTNILLGCKKHGYFGILFRKAMNFHGCPKCNQSTMESELEIELKKHKIEYIWQHHFDWMKTGTFSYLKYDFYIPAKGVAIECQGRQHFEEIGGRGNNELDENKRRDELKRKLSKEHNVPIIYLTEKRFEKYMTEDDVYFIKMEDLLEYIFTLEDKDVN